MTYSQPLAKHQFFAGILVSLALLSLPGVYPIVVLAHAGHGNEFKGGHNATQSKDAIAVDAETAKRMGLKVEPVASKRLALGIQTTGQIAHMPDRKVEVTTPIKGTVVKLFVEPGAVMEAGQVLAILSSPELGELRVTAIQIWLDR